MNKIFLTLLFSVSVFSNPMVLEYSDDCCEENPIEINLISSNSIDGITMNGVLNATMIGDMLNTITGSAKLSFNRESDNKSFTIETPYFGFKPSDQCIYDFYDESIGKCLIDAPVEFEINSLFDEYWKPFEMISIKNNELKVVHLFGFQRGMSSHDVYRIINTQDQFEVKFLYNFPGNAEWNEDGTFSYHVSGSAVSGINITVDEINGKWIDIKKVEYMCFSRGEQTYKVYEYDEVSDQLLLVINETTCPDE